MFLWVTLNVFLLVGLIQNQQLSALPKNSVKHSLCPLKSSPDKFRSSSKAQKGGSKPLLPW